MAYLEWDDLQGKSQADKDLFLIDRADQGLGEPEAPEAYILLSRLRRFSVPLFSGGLMAQPYLAIREMEQCISAENEMAAIRFANAQFAAANPPKS